MFYRSYDGVTFNDMSFPAKVNAFGLDRYEVTVGRFKPFVDKYDPNQLQRGDGRQLPPSKQDLVDSLTKCGGTPGATWGGADELPINCVSWPVAFAFCAWDGGRLPTEAEWNFAAAGGTDQRVYPWSFPPDASDISDTRAVYSVGAPAAVGSKPGGKGRFGQYDLAGNVAEWVRDGYAAYIMPCDNCAQSTQAQNSVRGGAFGDGPTSLTASVRGAEDPLHTTPNIGLRCARD
jgi:formylglycine-generating enzyme required for sulfatase activity